MSVTADSYNGTVTLEKRFKYIADDDSITFYEKGEQTDNSSIAGKTIIPAGNTNWEILQYAIDSAESGDTITLDEDYTADSEDAALTVDSDKTLTIDLNGHTIDRNLDSAEQYGCVFINSGALTVTGDGMITGGYNSGSGGAFCNNGTLTVIGGTFTGNTASEGGAIYNNGTLTITGGTFTGNTASDGGGIFYKKGSTLYLSGDTVITGNTTADGGDNDLYIDKNQNKNRIKINDVLDASSRIGICAQTPSSRYSFTTGLDENGSADSFISNNTGYEILANNDGEAYFSLVKYTVTVEAAENGTVTADKDTATYGETVTLTVTPDNGYSVSSVSVNGEAISAVSGEYSFEMPAEGVTVTAAFDYGNGIGARLVGRSISLDGDIGVNFYMELSDEVISHQDTAYMHFNIPKNGEPDTKDILVKDAEIKDVGGKTYYVFKCNVAAKEIDSEITAQIVDGDRSGELYTYSVREYADYLLSHLEVEEFAKAADLVRALITYGENAEYIFDKTNDEPAQVNTVIPEYDHTIHTLPSDVTFLGATLSLKSQTSLSLYFESEREIELSCDGQTTETAHAGKQYVIRIRNIPAAELNTYFTIKVDGEAAVTYSPLTYCYNAQSSEDTKLVNTVKALYLYWDAAEHYFNSSEYIGSEENETGKS